MSEERLDPVVEGVETPHLNGELHGDMPREASGSEVVHWMDKRPIRVGPAGLSAAALSGFALGVAATLSVLALCGWVGPERDLPDVRRVRL